MYKIKEERVKKDMSLKDNNNQFPKVPGIIVGYVTCLPTGVQPLTHEMQAALQS